MVIVISVIHWSRNVTLLCLAIALSFLAPSTESNAQTGSKPPPSAPDELRIVATEFKFAPQTRRVVANQPVILVFDNSQGETEHAISFPALGLHLFARAGAVKKQDYVFEHPGEYEFICDLPGHMEAGMKGKLIVSAYIDSPEQFSRSTIK